MTPQEEAERRYWEAAVRDATMPLGTSQIMRALNIDPASFVVNILPGSGDYLAFRDSMRQSGEAFDRLRAGDYQGAATRFLGSTSAGLETLPVFGAGARGVRSIARGAVHGVERAGEGLMRSLQGLRETPVPYSGPERALKTGGPGMATSGVVGSETPPAPLPNEAPGETWSQVGQPPRVDTPPSQWTFDAPPLPTPSQRIGTLPRIGGMTPDEHARITSLTGVRTSPPSLAEVEETPEQAALRNYYAQRGR